MRWGRPQGCGRGRRPTNEWDTCAGSSTCEHDRTHVLRPGAAPQIGARFSLAPGGARRALRPGAIIVDNASSAPTEEVVRRSPGTDTSVSRAIEARLRPGTPVSARPQASRWPSSTTTTSGCLIGYPCRCLCWSRLTGWRSRVQPGYQGAPKRDVESDSRLRTGHPHRGGCPPGGESGFQSRQYGWKVSRRHTHSQTFQSVRSRFPSGPALRRRRSSVPQTARSTYLRMVQATAR